MKKFIKVVRIVLVILSLFLLAFNIVAWIFGVKIYSSELLPILASSLLNLLLMLIYSLLGAGYIKAFNISETRAIGIGAKIGFGGNILFLMLSIVTIIGFGIIP